jgi:hypothetical protein
VFIALALLWGVMVDGFRPDRYDLLGAAICVVGVVVMVTPSKLAYRYSADCVERLYEKWFSEGISLL